MKIYKAQISYNNNDYNEWERIYTIESPWYSQKIFAEKHLPDFQLFKKKIEQCYEDMDNSYNFWCGEPEIIEEDIEDEFVPISNPEFDRYLQYTQERTLDISDVKLKVLLHVADLDSNSKLSALTADVLAVLPKENKTVQFAIDTYYGTCDKVSIEGYTQKSVNDLCRIATDFVEKNLKYEAKNQLDEIKTYTIGEELSTNIHVICRLISLIREDLIEVVNPEEIVEVLTKWIEYYTSVNWWDDLTNKIFTLKMLQEEIIKNY